MADAFLELCTPVNLDDRKTWIVRFLRILAALSAGNDLRLEFIEERYFTESYLPEEGSDLILWISGADAFPKISQLVVDEGHSAPLEMRITVWEEELSMLDVLTSSTTLAERLYLSPNSAPNSYMNRNRPDSIELIDLPTQTCVKVERIGNLAMSKRVALRFLSTKLFRQLEGNA
jgi:hypothetical protein